MRFVPAPSAPAPQVLRFQISKLEKALLLATVQVFPVLDPAYPRHTKDQKHDRPAEQRLLEEAMERQRSEHKARLDGIPLRRGTLLPGSRRGTLSEPERRAIGVALAGFE